jgi:O-acetyl-ADP-ribose deacetylase (regulator of RNase III)
MIKYIDRGDIFRLLGVTSYAHGCNCAGAMGKGIALQFKRKFHKMFLQYNSLCTSGNFKPGDIFPYEYTPGCYVYNLATQKHYAIHGQLAKLEHIRKSVSKMLEHASAHGVTDIALPKIGAGLGGLDWEDVKIVLEDVIEDYQEITLHVVEEYSPS